MTAAHLDCGAVSLKRCAVLGLMMLFHETTWLMDYVRPVVANTQDRGWDKRQTLEESQPHPAFPQDPSRITLWNLLTASLSSGTRVPVDPVSAHGGVRADLAPETTSHIQG